MHSVDVDRWLAQAKWGDSGKFGGKSGWSRIVKHWSGFATMESSIDKIEIDSFGLYLSLGGTGGWWLNVVPGSRFRKQV